MPHSSRVVCPKSGKPRLHPCLRHPSRAVGSRRAYRARFDPTANRASPPPRIYCRESRKLTESHSGLKGSSQSEAGSLRALLSLWVLLCLFFMQPYFRACLAPVREARGSSDGRRTSFIEFSDLIPVRSRATRLVISNPIESGFPRKWVGRGQGEKINVRRMSPHHASGHQVQVARTEGPAVLLLPRQAPRLHPGRPTRG